MPDPAASWRLKLARAQEHLDHFNEVVSEYTSTCQYPMRKGLEGEGKRRRTIHRIDIEQPDPALMLPVILGDFLYNVRSALDHIIVASVPRKRRYDAQFPIFTDDIWQRDRTGKYFKRHDEARANWYRWTTGLSPEALAIVHAAQPCNATDPDPFNLGVRNHVLAILSALQNADKHRELVVVGGFVVPKRVLTFKPDGEIGEIRTSEAPPPGQSHHILENGAEFGLDALPDIDPDTVEVKVQGTVEVLVGRRGDNSPKWNLKTLSDLHGFANNRIVDLDALLP